MRDIILVAYFAIMLVLAFRKPSAGLAVWIWTALISPKHVVYGFAADIRFNFYAAAVTIVSYIISKNKARMASSSLCWFVYLFLFWTILSSFFAIHESKAITEELDTFVRGIALFFFALLLLNKKVDFNLVCWAIVLSIGFISGVEGLKFIASGGGHRIFGPGGKLGDNNHLALAINMMIPFAIFLLSDIKRTFLRVCFILFLIVTVLAVVGTFSRGGFAGLSMLIFSWILISERKMILIVATLILGVVMASYIPQSYVDRISTIGDASEDRSFDGRMVAWKQSVLIALDNPMTGGGFHAVQTRHVWEKYAEEFDKLDFIETRHAADMEFKAAHSIYFQVLGDQGFAGLLIYLAIFVGAGIKARKLSRLKGLPEEYAWINQLARSCFFSLLMFGVCGALLSLAYFELSFLIVAMLVALHNVARKVAIPDNKTAINRY